MLRLILPFVLLGLGHLSYASEEPYRPARLQMVVQSGNVIKDEGFPVCLRKLYRFFATVPVERQLEANVFITHRSEQYPLDGYNPDTHRYLFNANRWPWEPIPSLDEEEEKFDYYAQRYAGDDKEGRYTLQFFRASGVGGGNYGCIMTYSYKVIDFSVTESPRKF